jgi:hypothetical protein
LSKGRWGAPRRCVPVGLRTPCLGAGLAPQLRPPTSSRGTGGVVAHPSRWPADGERAMGHPQWRPVGHDPRSASGPTSPAGVHTGSSPVGSARGGEWSDTAHGRPRAWRVRGGRRSRTPRCSPRGRRTGPPP